MKIQEGVNFAVNNCIKSLLLEVIAHPLSYFSERMLQTMLVTKMLAHEEMATPVPTALPEKYKHYIRKSAMDAGAIENQLAVTPLQMEYGARERHRIDICVLENENIRKINHWQFLVQEGPMRKYTPPHIGIEIGTEKTRNKCKHLERDLLKLENCKQGYILHIERVTNVRAGKSFEAKRRQLAPFKEHFAKLAPHYEPRISFIGLILYIMPQRAEFFTKANTWEEFPVSSDALHHAIQEKFCQKNIETVSG